MSFGRFPDAPSADDLPDHILTPSEVIQNIDLFASVWFIEQLAIELTVAQGQQLYEFGVMVTKVQRFRERQILLTKKEGV